MADRFPLIANSSSNQIQELASGDNLDLTGSGIHNAGIITATTFSGALDGNATTATNASGLTGVPSITVQDITAEQVSIAGTLTYEDVTNIDSVGLITARSGVHFGATGSGTLVVGDADGIGIGTANPDSKIHILEENSGNKSLHVQVADNTAEVVHVVQSSNEYLSIDTTNSSELITLGNNTTNPNVFIPGGNLGIGTDNPSDKLHIFNSTSSGLRLEVPQGVAIISSVQSDNNIANGTFAGDLAIRSQSGISLSPDNGTSTKVRITSAGILSCTNAIAAQGGNAPSGGFQLVDASGTLRPRVTSDGDDATVIRAGSATGGVKFNNFANSSELAVLTNSGNLGIGSDSPGNPLTIDSGSDQIKLSDGAGSFEIRAGNALLIKDNGSERLRIDSTGNVGINTDNPGFMLDVGNNGQHGTVRIRGNANSLLNITAANDGIARLEFGDVDDDDIGRIYYGNDDNSMRFTVNGTERLAITNQGNFHFKNGALIENGEVDATGRNGTQAINLSAGMVYFITGASGGTWKPNFRIDGSNTLNGAMDTGDVVSPTMIVAKGATTHFSNTIQIDGSDVTPEFLGGAPTDGGGSGTFDIYSYTIIKTGDAAFSVFASVSTFE